MLKEFLCQIGLTSNESDVYIELLRIGSQPVSVVSSRLGVNRSSSYSILESLLAKGMVCVHLKNNVRHYSPCDPNVLLGFIDQKCRTFDYYRSQVKNLIPKFRGIDSIPLLSKPSVSYYDGIDGVKSVMFDALSSRGVFRSYFSIDSWFKCGLGDFISNYTLKRVARRSVPHRAIVPDSPFVHSFCADHYSVGDLFTEFLFVNPDTFGDVFDTEMNIYDDSVSILSLVPGKEYAIVIESKEIAQMQRLLFDRVYITTLNNEA